MGCAMVKLARANAILDGHWFQIVLLSNVLRIVLGMESVSMELVSVMRDSNQLQIVRSNRALLIATVEESARMGCAFARSHSLEWIVLD